MPLQADTAGPVRGEPDDPDGEPGRSPRRPTGHSGGVWWATRGAYFVPSQSQSDTRYRIEPAAGRCDCPDNCELGLTSKHIYG